jgi:hypothetical protein
LTNFALNEQLGKEGKKGNNEGKADDNDHEDDGKHVGFIIPSPKTNISKPSSSFKPNQSNDANGNCQRKVPSKKQSGQVLFQKVLSPLS